MRSSASSQPYARHLPEPASDATAFSPAAGASPPPGKASPCPWALDPSSFASELL